MREIANAADLSLAGLYHYVKGKEELLFLAIDSSLDSLLENLEIALSGAASAQAKLLALSETHLAFALENGSALKVILRDLENLDESNREGPAEKREAYIARSLEILRAIDPHGRSDEDLLAATNLLLAMLNAVVTRPFLAASLKPGERAIAVSDLFMYGFAGQTPEGASPRIPPTEAAKSPEVVHGN